MTAPLHCEITMEILEPANHRYRFRAIDLSGHGTVFPHCEVDGLLNFEAAAGISGEAQNRQRVEIRHS